MKVKIIFVLLCINSTVVMVFGQIKYEAGYYIDNTGRRYEGLILNKDWRDNPVDFKFKATETDNAQHMSLANVKEFGLGQFRKFVRAVVRMDATTKSYQRAPEWQEVEIFLSVIVESEAVTLLRVSKDNTNRFFFSVDGKTPEQLVYKKYLLVNKQNSQQFFEAVNNDYLVQLKQIVSCGTLESQQPQYNYKDLKKYFADYADCKQTTITFSDERKSKLKLSVAPQIGFEFSSYQTSTKYFFVNYDFEYPKGESLRLGIESELTLPFNNGRWSLVLAPSYKGYEGTSQKIYGSKVSGNTGYLRLQGLELPLGVSYNLFITDKTKAFVRGYMLRDFLFKSEFRNDITGVVTTQRPVVTLSPALGGGLSLGKFSIEARYYAPKNFIGTGGWRSEYRSIAFFACYKLK